MTFAAEPPNLHIFYFDNDLFMTGSVQLTYALISILLYLNSGSFIVHVGDRII